jgi:hypothetical protein
MEYLRPSTRHCFMYGSHAVRLCDNAAWNGEQLATD